MLRLCLLHVVYSDLFACEIRKKNMDNFNIFDKE